MKAINLCCNPTMTVVALYAPTDLAPDEEKDAFYDSLSIYQSTIPSHNLHLVAGDFNARVGMDAHRMSPRTVSQYAYHELTNSNGERLVELCESANLALTFHRQPRKQQHMWTWEHPNAFKWCESTN